MKLLAVISCKAKKKDYKCSAEEMYSDSPQFKHQMGFIKEYYNDYKILSVKYGIVGREDIIEPYNLTLTGGTNMMSSNPTITEESRERWATKVKKQIADLSFEYDRIDLHLSESYFHEIQEVIQIPNVIHVKLPNILEVKANYTKATELYHENGDVTLEVVGSYVRWKKAFKHELLNKKMVLPWK
tara:strand:- start:1460 stop:2014 length:555 start_codon:yes stop_codon:yes gene_type:complete